MRPHLKFGPLQFGQESTRKGALHLTHFPVRGNEGIGLCGFHTILTLNSESVKPVRISHNEWHHPNNQESETSSGRVSKRLDWHRE